MQFIGLHCSLQTDHWRISGPADSLNYSFIPVKFDAAVGGRWSGSGSHWAQVCSTRALFQRYPGIVFKPVIYPAIKMSTKWICLYKGSPKCLWLILLGSLNCLDICNAWNLQPLPDQPYPNQITVIGAMTNKAKSIKQLSQITICRLVASVFPNFYLQSLSTFLSQSPALSTRTATPFLQSCIRNLAQAPRTCGYGHLNMEC